MDLSTNMRNEFIPSRFETNSKEFDVYTKESNELHRELHMATQHRWPIPLLIKYGQKREKVLSAHQFRVLSNLFERGDSGLHPRNGARAPISRGQASQKIHQESSNMSPWERLLYGALKPVAALWN